eukprot:6491827-Amphidinium_carterae.3
MATAVGSRQDHQASEGLKVKGTQHPLDAGLMEPESLVTFGYEIPDSAGVHDKLDRSSMVASIGIASLLSGRELDRCAASFIVVMAAGAAPLRAAATGQELTSTITSNYFNSEVALRLIGSILLVSITTIVIAVCANMGWHQQMMPRINDAITQTDQDQATGVAGPDEVFVYPQRRRYHTARECHAVTSAKSRPRQYTKCRICALKP